MYYIFGKIFYNLAKFEPIDLEDLESASLYVQDANGHATWGSVLQLTQQIFMTEAQILAGEYDLDQPSFDVIAEYEEYNHQTP